MTAPERLAALSRLLGRTREQAERFIGFAAQEKLPLDDLWACFDHEERMEAVALLSPGHGRTAMLTLNPLRGAREERAGIETVRAVLADCDGSRLALVQALLEPRQRLEATALSAAGMRVLATLNYMERLMPRAVRDAPGEPIALPAEAATETFTDTPEARAELSALLDATYEDTLDCPGLSGLRTPEDILEGHRRGGRFDPSLWTILRLDGRAAGAVLLNPSPNLAGSELVYLGLVPSARGRGLGRSLLECALEIAARRGDRAIMLAVDEENAPAQRLYRASGFRRTARRVAFVAPISGARGSFAG